MVSTVLSRKNEGHFKKFSLFPGFIPKNRSICCPPILRNRLYRIKPQDDPGTQPIKIKKPMDCLDLVGITGPSGFGCLFSKKISYLFSG